MAGTGTGGGERVLTLVIGRAGSGKTHRCLEAVAAELRREGVWSGPPLFLLVPEQATAQTERALLERLGGAGAAYGRAHVLSFRRLAHRVLEEQGGAPRPAVNAVGKRMILRRVLDECDARSGFFRESSTRAGFIEVIQRTLDELRRYRVDSEALRARADAARRSGDETFAGKLEEISRIADEFRARVARQFTDPEDLLALAASRIPGASLVRGARVWIDGFVGFTPQEYALLESVFSTAGSVEVALCLDPDLAGAIEAAPSSRRTVSTFDPTARTLARLREAAERSGRRAETLFLRDVHRFGRETPLGRLERWCAGGLSETIEGGAEAIAFVEAADRRAEVEAAAVECLRLCRDEGYRFRDIALLARDLDPYADLITTVFRELRIPFFLDRRRPLAHHPLAELLRSALEILVGGWSPESVFRLLRTDLVVPAERRDEVDRLEKHVRAHGFQGDASYGEALGPVRDLRNALRAGEPLTARIITEHLDGFLAQLGVAKTLEDWSHGAGGEDGPKRVEDEIRAAGHRQVWSGVVDLLEQMVAALGEAPITLEAYAEALGAGLDALSEALPPPALDQVLIGSVERSRHPELRAAFVLGLNERLFPRVRSEDPILRDAERERLGNEGLELAFTSETDLLHERYYFYIAATRARERVYFSRSRSDETGRPLGASSYWTDLLRACPGAGVRPWPGRAWEGDVTPARLAGGVAAALRSRRPELRRPALAAYELMLSRSEFRTSLERVMPSLDPPFEERLSTPSVLGLYGTTLHLSASQLESFGACPFQYLARHGLGLEEPEEIELQPSDVGRLCHEALRGFTEAMLARGDDWSRASREELHRALEVSFDRAAGRLRDPEFRKSPRNAQRLLLLERELRLFVEYLAHTCAASRFRPKEAELAFGMEGAALPALEFAVGDGRRAILRGKIDRVDIEDRPEGVLAFAVDYKSSKTTIEAADAAEGVELQLLVYLLVLERVGAERFGKKVVPAGAAYQVMRLGLLENTDDESSPQEGAPEFMKSLRKKFEAHGVADPLWAETGIVRYRTKANLVEPGSLSAILACTEKRIAGFGGRILAGDCDVSPYQGRSQDGLVCTYCPFGDVCGFERRLRAPRRPRLCDPHEAWKRMAEAGASGEDGA